MGHTMSFRFHFQKLFRNFSSSSSAANTSTIGIVKRYEQFQKEFPEHLILIQVGDFYEIYGNAVEDAAKILEIAVTRTPGKPSSATNSSTNTPMTGFPVRSFDTFLKKLIKAGVSVVVADQVPIPDSARFDRKVSRIITPGTVLEESLLDRNLNNFILFLDQNESSSKKGITCAWMDISTGDFFTGSCANETELVNLLSRLKPREIVAESPVSSSYFLLSEFLKHDSILFRLAPPNNARKFDLDFAVEPGLSNKELEVSRKLLQHIKNSLRGALSSIAFKPLTRFAPGQKYLEIDADSFRSLDILSNSSSSASPTATLFHTLNECKTALGSRLLARRLQAPLLDPVEINEALNRVEKFLACGKDSVKALQRKLDQIGDIERVLQRLCLRRPQGVSRDLKSLAKFLISSQEAIEEFFNHEQDRQNAPSRGLNSKLLEHFSLIIRVLNQEKLPLRDADGNLFISGWNSELDDLRRLRDDSVSIFSDLAASYRQSTGIPNLKVISFKSEQYVVEVPKAAGPLNSEIFRPLMQTESKARYTTEELITKSFLLRTVSERISEQELALLRGLLDPILEASNEIRAVANLVAQIDLESSLALLALEHNYTRPLVHSDTDGLEIIDGRHPVLDKLFHSHQEDTVLRHFTPNSLHLSSSNGKFLLLTGPNMGGKSTFLRQNALIVLMAQCGSFVPASRCSFAPIDAIFTRIGASDDLSKDRSTFMLEMSEAAAILKKATPRSLVLIDEIGRGTSAAEGLALASAIAKHLIHSNRSCVLFATHYHEIIKSPLLLAPINIEGPLDNSSYIQMACTDAEIHDDGSVVLIPKVRPGVATHSYALPVAALAGIPESVITDAKHQLDRLKTL